MAAMAEDGVEIQHIETALMIMIMIMMMMIVILGIDQLAELDAGIIDAAAAAPHALGAAGRVHLHH